MVPNVRFVQVVVQCKGPPEGDNDDVLDMDLETFLYDEFPVRYEHTLENSARINLQTTP